jgi:hypothetical protein
VKLTRLEGEQRELFSIGLAGVIGICLGLYALVFPAFAVIELLDGQSADLASTAISVVIILLATAAIVAELVVSAAAIRMVFAGRWPGRRFVLGPPAALIGAAACGVTAVLAALL